MQNLQLEVLVVSASDEFLDGPIECIVSTPVLFESESYFRAKHPQSVCIPLTPPAILSGSVCPNYVLDLQRKNTLKSWHYQHGARILNFFNRCDQVLF